MAVEELMEHSAWTECRGRVSPALSCPGLVFSHVRFDV